MTSGVLQFVKGIDFSRNDFSGDRFPHEVEQMTQMTWLKLNKSKLERVPDELSRCANLEHLQMAHNQLTSVHGELSDLPRLRSVIVRDNNLKTAGIPTDIFRMKDLTLIDLSRNQLREVPPNLEYAKGAIVLNLSHNNIETIPNAVFANLIDLLNLDLSNNKLDVLPPQIRRLTMLQSLKLSNNPLTHFQLKQLPSMASLTVLHMRNTNRTLENIPPYLDDLHSLKDVDFAENGLVEVPDAIFKIRNLQKLDLSGNKISKINFAEGEWALLRTLNLNDNQLSTLPPAIAKLENLQRLYASHNQLTFEGVSRCVKLQRLKLDHNKLITLPEGIHLLPDLKELDLHENENLVMPPKPNDARKKLAFYNIDFSLEHQKRVSGQMMSAGSSMSSVNSGGAKDALSRRKDFIRRRRKQADQQGADKVIQGMSKIAGAGAAMKERQEEEEKQIEARSAVNWKKNLERNRKKIDYSDIFDEDIGHEEGLWVWEIENFYPSILDDAYHGQFYDADCYLVLKTTRNLSGHLDHQIYYWLGEHATLDKGMCAAVHAVGLRNHLNASCRTIREEMNDESEEFLTLFGEEVMYIDGARTSTGFYTMEKPPHITRLYRTLVNGTCVEMEPVPLSIDSLDPRYCFLLQEKLFGFGAKDFKCVTYIWQGRDASNMGWLNFTFTMQPKFEEMFKDKLEVVRMFQQQENHKFLSHFKRKFVIKRGRRGLTKCLGGKWPELYQMRANGSSVCTRTIQIDCVSSQLCSAFCHVLRIPYKDTVREDGRKGMVYVWKGKDAEPSELDYAKDVASSLIIRDDDENYGVEVVNEGEEPSEFWEALQGQKKYEKDATFVRYTRLFRCTNEKGYFAVSEKTVDFCQDDLDDDDIMILDNGDQIFLWVGTRASDVEAKLAYKAATVYQAHLKMKEHERPRALKLSLKNLESARFRKCFHAWGKHKVAIGN